MHSLALWPFSTWSFGAKWYSIHFQFSLKLKRFSTNGMAKREPSSTWCWECVCVCVQRTDTVNGFGANVKFSMQCAFDWKRIYIICNRFQIWLCRLTSLITTTICTQLRPMSISIPHGGLYLQGLKSVKRAIDKYLFIRWGGTKGVRQSVPNFYESMFTISFGSERRTISLNDRIGPDWPSV